MRWCLVCEKLTLTLFEIINSKETLIAIEVTVFSMFLGKFFVSFVDAQPYGWIMSLPRAAAPWHATLTCWTCYGFQAAGQSRALRSINFLSQSMYPKSHMCLCIITEGVCVCVRENNLPFIHSLRCQHFDRYPRAGNKPNTHTHTHTNKMYLTCFACENIHQFKQNV